MRLPDLFHWTPEERRAVIAILLFTGGGGLVVELLQRFPPGPIDLKLPGDAPAVDSSALVVAPPESNETGPAAMGMLAPGAPRPAPTADRREDAPPGAGGAPDVPPPAGPVDVNRAGVEELTALPGIGPRLAERIVADRSTRGPYRRIEDLDRVKGIGPSMLRRLAPHVRVGPAPGDSAAAGHR